MILHVDLSECWIGKVKNKFPVDISLLDTIPMPDDIGGVQDLVDVTLNDQDPKEIEDTLISMEGIDFVTSSRNDGTKVKMIIGTSSCKGCRALAAAEAFLLSAKVLDDGWVEWKVVHDRRDPLDRLRVQLDKAGMKNRVIDIKESMERETLTKDQELVLKTALEMGYFDFPKRAGVRELAKKLNVSTAYISYTLRSAQKSTIMMYLKR